MSVRTRSFPVFVTERQRGNLKIETKRSIFSVRMSDFWATLNTRTLSNFRGRKVTIKLKEDKRGRRQTTRENPVPPSPPPRTRVCFCNRATTSTTLLVSAIIRQRNPFVQRDTSEISFCATYPRPRHKTRGVSYCRNITPHILKYYAMKDPKSVYACV